ncbi:hypothetical protein ABEB36_009229 [Hypothenemus hampei]|uniref:Uncharacterized protein n=1 Tax=Hypothenemus hampei TaxID=57062 RepID=A0ABD1EPK3_HYPHA
MHKPLSRASNELVAFLINYFEQEKEAGGPLLPLTAVKELVAVALNLNISTVSAISKVVKNNEVLSSPKEKLRQNVTLKTLHQKLKDRMLFSDCQSSLHTLLKELGFKWQKDNPRRRVASSPDYDVRQAI